MALFEAIAFEPIAQAPVPDRIFIQRSDSIQVIGPCPRWAAANATSNKRDIGDDRMWKDTAATEAPTNNVQTAATVKPVTEDELRGILDRLEATREIFRQNRELRGVLSRREAETQTLRTRNAELEDIMRKFAPMLLNVATTMGLAAKNEKFEAPS
jgi:hypothetical protein